MSPPTQTSCMKASFCFSLCLSPGSIALLPTAHSNLNTRSLNTRNLNTRNLNTRSDLNRHLEPAISVGTERQLKSNAAFASANGACGAKRHRMHRQRPWEHEAKSEEHRQHLYLSNGKALHRSRAITRIRDPGGVGVKPLGCHVQMPRDC